MGIEDVWRRVGSHQARLAVRCAIFMDPRIRAGEW